ncbi:MAG: hypothetical protein JNM22_03165 [Saprospiraceae bacterium]|nr:hypothetical protein [Saprospiraceae bacterium]
MSTVFALLAFALQSRYLTPPVDTCKTNLQKLLVESPQDPYQLNIELSGIFMGECGRPENCHHEKVAGLVLGVVTDQNGNPIASNRGSNIYWRSGEHTLVCDNYAPYSWEEYGGGEGLGTRYPKANNINRLMTYSVDRQMVLNGAYYFTVNFNLGNPHQDNPFASTGHHWLRYGDERIEVRVNLKNYVNGDHILIGPYHTDSDRCHEYYLQFFVTGE